MTILSQYNPKKRFQIILGLLIFLIFIAYNFSIRNTLQTKRQLNKKEAKLSIIENAPQQIAQLRIQVAQLNDNLSMLPYNRNNLFSEVSQFCTDNDLLLKEFGEETRVEDKQLLYITNPIQITGGFHQIVRFIYHLEQVAPSGYLVHSNIEMLKKVRSKKKELTADIHVQHLEILEK